MASRRIVIGATTAVLVLLASCSSGRSRGGVASSAAPTTTARSVPSSTTSPPVTSTTTTTVVAPTTTQAPATVVTIYAPWQGGALVGVTVASTISGNCWTGSDAASRSDAWRCMSDNQIIDPCFSDPGNVQGHEVACPDPQHLAGVTVIRLTQPLDPSVADKDNPAADPWALSIAGGAMCEIITGATDVVAGRRLNYACTDQSSLYGDPDRTSPSWTIFRGTQGSAELAPVAILHAWE